MSRSGESKADKQESAHSAECLSKVGSNTEDSVFDREQFTQSDSQLAYEDHAEVECVEASDKDVSDTDSIDNTEVTVLRGETFFLSNVRSWLGANLQADGLSKKPIDVVDTVVDGQDAPPSPSSSSPLSVNAPVFIPRTVASTPLDPHTVPSQPLPSLCLDAPVFIPRTVASKPSARPSLSASLSNLSRAAPVFTPRLIASTPDTRPSPAASSLPRLSSTAPVVGPRMAASAPSICPLPPASLVSLNRTTLNPALAVSTPRLVAEPHMQNVTSQTCTRPSSAVSLSNLDAPAFIRRVATATHVRQAIPVFVGQTPSRPPRVPRAYGATRSSGSPTLY